MTWWETLIFSGWFRLEVAVCGGFMTYFALRWPPAAFLAVACAVFCTRPWLDQASPLRAPMTP